MKSQSPVKFSGIVVTFNEARHLPECLSRLSFCDELIVVDLGSTDGSPQIAADFGAKIVHHEWVTVVEQVRQFAVDQAKNDWIVFVDPDMIFPSRLLDCVREAIQRDQRLGIITVPYQNYFMGTGLRYGRWGGYRNYSAVMHRKRVDLSSLVHRGISLRRGFKSFAISERDVDVIRHYWIDSYKELIEKHTRYLRLEGQARYEIGERFSWTRMLFSVPRQVMKSLMWRRGILDGPKGVFLSMFWGWYLWESYLSLRRYQYKLPSRDQEQPRND